MAEQARVEALIAAYRQLQHARRIEELLAAGADLAPATCGFTRAVVASVHDGHLTTINAVPLRAPGSDALRRLILADPPSLTPGTEESEHVRLAARPRARSRPSRVAARLGLSEYAFGAIAPESSTIALLIVDRPAPGLSDQDRFAVDAFAATIGVALEQLVLRRRVADLAQEIRQFAGTVQALAAEAIDAPPVLDDAVVLAFAGAAGSSRSAPTQLLERLSDTERRTATLLAEGRSNREIADALVVSPETVKSQVTRILRKLGAANRVEAAALLLKEQRDRFPGSIG